MATRFNGRHQSPAKLRIGKLNSGAGNLFRSGQLMILNPQLCKFNLHKNMYLQVHKWDTQGVLSEPPADR